MMAAFQRLELWPPRPAPEGIEEDDCCYEADGAVPGHRDGDRMGM